MNDELCPKCQGTDIDMHDIETDYNQIRGHFYCMECEATWANTYEFTRQDVSE